MAILVIAVVIPMVISVIPANRYTCRRPTLSTREDIGSRNLSLI